MSFNFGALLRAIASAFGNRAPSTPTARWSMTIYVSPVDADVQLQFDGKTWPAGPGGETPRVIQFDASRAKVGVTGLLVVSRDGYVTQKLPISSIGPPSLTVNVTLQPDVVTLPRLVTDGHVFRLATDERWTAIEASDFNLFARFLHEGAEAIIPVLHERSSIGFNLLRVWTRFDVPNIGRLWPTDWNGPADPDLYTRLSEFCQLCARYRLYLELTAFTGGYTDAHGSVDDHWRRLNDAVFSITNAIIDGVNEDGMYPGPLNIVTRLRPVDGVLASTGTGPVEVPPRPAWSYETLHTNDQYEWWRKGGHNGMELSQGTDGIVGSGLPVLANENTRPDRDDNLAHHEDAAAAAALLIAGSCFHSRSGSVSSLFTDADRPFAEAFVRGARSVPLDCQSGPYRHRSDLETPDLLRVYQRGNDDACIVRIRK